MWCTQILYIVQYNYENLAIEIEKKTSVTWSTMCSTVLLNLQFFCAWVWSKSDTHDAAWLWRRRAAVPGFHHTPHTQLHHSSCNGTAQGKEPTKIQSIYDQHSCNSYLEGHYQMVSCFTDLVSLFFLQRSIVGVVSLTSYFTATQWVCWSVVDKWSRPSRK